MGILLVAACALAAVVWQHSANATTTVVVARRAISRGAVITADDLGGAELAGETATMIAGADAHLLLGRAAAVDIDAGVPLTHTLLTDAPPLASDEALIGVALEPGELPPDLAPRDHVRLVVTVDGAPGEPPIASLADDDAVVWSVDHAPDDIVTIVTLRGPLRLATQIAAASGVQLVRIAGD